MRVVSAESGSAAASSHISATHELTPYCLYPGVTPAGRACQWLIDYARVRGATLCLHGLEIDKKVTLGRELLIQPSGIHATADLSANLKAAKYWQL